MPPEMLTAADGPVVISAKTLDALMSIRRENLLPYLYGRVTISKSNFVGLNNVLPNPPTWLAVTEDRPEQPLPGRVADAKPLDAATLRLALAADASLVLLDGAIKERAKLSFIKAEGTLSILVLGFRHDKVTAVRPMVKALEKLGHADVLPSPEQLDALWRALDALRDN